MTIFTTNLKGDDKNAHQDESQRDNYNQIKKSFMGKNKALIIQLNEDQRQVSKFEKINHNYIICKNDKDKFLILFALKKLALVQGKLIIYVNDIM